MQLPSNLILTRVRPSIYLPLFVCIWSAVSAFTAAASNYKQLLAIRFILGISEAPFFPGVFYLLSCWYTRRELALRTAILYSGVILATAFSGLIAAGVFARLELLPHRRVLPARRPARPAHSRNFLAGGRSLPLLRSAARRTRRSSPRARSGAEDRTLERAGGQLSKGDEDPLVYGAGAIFGGGLDTVSLSDHLFNRISLI